MEKETITKLTKTFNYQKIFMKEGLTTKDLLTLEVRAIGLYLEAITPVL
jgi:hypothetical protein